MRGQAFVVFREVSEATAAKNNLNGYPVFGKPMVDIDLIVENPFCCQAQQNRHIRLKVICVHLYLMLLDHLQIKYLEYIAFFVIL